MSAEYQLKLGHLQNAVNILLRAIRVKVNDVDMIEDKLKEIKAKIEQKQSEIESSKVSIDNE